MSHKLILPKSIFINGRKFKIIRKRGRKGAEFHVQHQEIIISEGLNKSEEFRWLIHEILEILMCIYNARYEDEYNDSILVMKHEKFELITDQLTTILQDIRKQIPGNGK